MISRLLAAWLRRVAGDELSSDILGDVAESRAGSWRIGVITAGITLRLMTAWFGHAVRRGFGSANVTHDVRFAVRSLRRAPWYATAVIGVIALSMSLATTVFGVVDGVLFKPLPYPDAGHLYEVTGGWHSTPDSIISPSWSDIAAWRTAMPEAAFAVINLGGRQAIDSGAPVRSAYISREFFDVIGQRPLLGGFRAEHFRAFHEHDVWPVILTYDAWQSRYGGDPTLIGRVIVGENDARSEIVGVLPPDFVFPTADGRFVPEAIVPEFEPVDQARNRERAGYVIARTPPHLSTEVFQARMDATNAALQQDFPKAPGERGLGPYDFVSAVPIDVALGARTRPMFVVATAGAAILVLLACLNVAGLGATRIYDRHHELGLRLALGGSRRDIVRVLASEAAVVALAGGAIGLLGAIWLVKLVASVMPDMIYLLKPLAIDGRVAAFTFAACALIIALTTLWPAREAFALSLRTSLEGPGGIRRARSRARFVMVGAQVALGLVMAICGTLVLGSLMEVWRQQPGYDPANTVFLDLRARTRGDMAVNHEILVTLRGVPGVVAAGGSNNWFMSRAFNGSSFDRPSGAGVIPGHGIQDEGIMPGFFEAAGLPLLKGRWPTAAELLGAEGVVVVNDNTAKAYWPGRDPIGQQLMRRGRPFSVIGVVPNVRQLALDIESDGIIYFPLAASNYPVLQTVFVRFADGVRPDLPRLIERLQSPRFSSYAVRRALTMSGALGESVRNRKFHTLVFAAFGIAAVAIVGAGVLGLVAMVTSRRTRELGVRIALGAHPAMIVRLVVRQEFAAVIAGGAAGGMVSWWAVRFVEAYLFKTSTHDPRLWLISALVLLTVTLAGAAVPAIRASRIDPVRALRAE